MTVRDNLGPSSNPHFHEALNIVVVGVNGGRKVRRSAAER